MKNSEIKPGQRWSFKSYAAHYIVEVIKEIDLPEYRSNYYCKLIQDLKFPEANLFYGHEECLYSVNRGENWTYLEGQDAPKNGLEDLKDAISACSKAFEIKFGKIG